MMKVAKFLALGLALAVLGSSRDGFVQAQKPQVVEAAGDAVEVGKAFESFKLLLGGVDNGNAPGPIVGGFRSIDWDAAAVPFDMPGNFFRDVVTRGILLEVVGNEFRVSNPSDPADPGFPDNLFDSINPQNAAQFQAFSPMRIFSPLSDRAFVETYFVPGTTPPQPATIAGYGAVFGDVDLGGITKIEFFDVEGKPLGSYAVKPAPKELSFLGVYFGKSVVAKVTVSLGNAGLGEDDVPPRYDVVVMDDFLYSEPVAIDNAKYP